MVKKSRLGKWLSGAKNLTRIGAGDSRKLMAYANISEHRVRRILECYAARMTVAEASADTRVSHVTIGRIFTLARQRLLAAGVYDTPAGYAELLIDAENGGGSYYDQADFEKPIHADVGRKRGVSDENRILYEAEALYRQKNPTVTSSRLMEMLMAVIKDTGPLDRPLRRPASLSAMERSFHYYAVDTGAMVKAKAREAERRGDPVQASNWETLFESMQRIEAGMGELRDDFNRAVDEAGIDWSSVEALPEPVATKPSPPAQEMEEAVPGASDPDEAAGETEPAELSPEELQAQAEAVEAERTSFRIRSDMQVLIAALRQLIATLVKDGGDTARDRFEIGRRRLQIEFCQRVENDPELLMSEAGAALEEQYEKRERALAKSYGVEELE